MEKDLTDTLVNLLSQSNNSSFEFLNMTLQTLHGQPSATTTGLLRYIIYVLCLNQKWRFIFPSVEFQSPWYLARLYMKTDFLKNWDSIILIDARSVDFLSAILFLERRDQVQLSITTSVSVLEDSRVA